MSDQRRYLTSLLKVRFQYLKSKAPAISTAISSKASQQFTKKTVSKPTKHPSPSGCVKTSKEIIESCVSSCGSFRRGYRSVRSAIDVRECNSRSLNLSKLISQEIRRNKTWKIIRFIDLFFGSVSSFQQFSLFSLHKCFITMRC